MIASAALLVLVLLLATGVCAAVAAQGPTLALSPSTVVPGGVPALRPEVNGFWYKAGRLDAYASPAPEATSASQKFFQAWCGEPGGWLVVAVDTNPSMAPVTVRVTEVIQHY